jgi:hypothetical protein
MTDGKRGEKTPFWPSFPMRSRQSKRRILPQSFDNSRDDFPYSTRAPLTTRIPVSYRSCEH